MRREDEGALEEEIVADSGAAVGEEDLAEIAEVVSCWILYLLKDLKKKKEDLGLEAYDSMLYQQSVNQELLYWDHHVIFESFAFCWALRWIVTVKSESAS